VKEFRAARAALGASTANTWTDGVSKTRELLEVADVQLEKMDLLTGDAAASFHPEKANPQLMAPLYDQQVTITHGDGSGLQVWQILNVLGPRRTIKRADSDEVIRKKG